MCVCGGGGCWWIERAGDEEVTDFWVTFWSRSAMLFSMRKMSISSWEKDLAMVLACVRACVCHVCVPCQQGMGIRGR